MSTPNEKERLDFDLAFSLGYFIHAKKEIAFFIAEDAVDQLPLMMGKQKTNRRPSKLLSGFWKGGERSRPIRQTIRLTERQMLQWLCYKQSEYWERQTEAGQGFYTPTEEDMIVRYLSHLVFLTLRRGSFYVSLAIGQLLHQFDRRETRLLYDILTQSDSARMKDTGYIGKQRLELLAKVCQRFGDIILTAKTPGGEKQIVTRPTTELVIDLVQESLRRFTPWDTKCILESRFDVTDIPGFYFSGTDCEDGMEMDRIHTVVEPDCFARFADGLCKYARALPDDSPDKGCDFELPNRRFAVPQFFGYSSGPTVGDRFQVPSLTREDYVRLQRTLQARSRRRKSFAAQQLSVHVDGDQVQTPDLRASKNRIVFWIGPEAGLLEVRGRDEVGELALATVLVELIDIPVGGSFIYSVVDKGGQRVRVRLTPIRDSKGEVTGASVVVTYAASRLKSSVVAVTNFYRAIWAKSGSRFPRWLTVGAIVAVTIACFLILWFQVFVSERIMKPEQQAERAKTEDRPATQSTVPQVPAERSQRPAKAQPMVARASWSRDPLTALSAVTVEPTREGVTTIDFSRGRSRVLLRLPVYDDNRPYIRYRITLVGSAGPLWQHTLPAPRKSLTGTDHILNLLLFPEQLTRENLYDLRIEGWTRVGWRPLGHLMLNRANR